LLECMGNGMAAVTTDHAAICDVVTDGQNGVLLAKNQEQDAQAVYEKMLCLIESLPRIASDNYHKIRTHYTQARYISQLEALFLNI
ncbi:MAG: glycosyltransferase, partial [Clostridia bacterium]|nr:glycosyltransferase [Clostridia bacterium]